MFTVQSLFTAVAKRRLLRDLQPGVKQRGVNRTLPLRLQVAGVNGDTLLDKGKLQRVGEEQLPGKAPQTIDRPAAFSAPTPRCRCPDAPASRG
ncbi:Uncharacterised protein [Raoultella ornithinolytica]|nr:Uncharacterised protein [Raoultella ornithinolytica]